VGHESKTPDCAKNNHPQVFEEGRERIQESRLLRTDGNKWKWKLEWVTVESAFDRGRSELSLTAKRADHAGERKCDRRQGENFGDQPETNGCENRPTTGVIHSRKKLKESERSGVTRGEIKS